MAQERLSWAPAAGAFSLPSGPALHPAPPPPSARVKPTPPSSAPRTRSLLPGVRLSERFLAARPSCFTRGHRPELVFGFLTFCPDEEAPRPPPRTAPGSGGREREAPAWPRGAADATWAPSFQNEKLSRNETRMDGDGSLRLARALRNATQHTDVLFGDDVRTAYQLLARVLQHESRQQGFELAATQDANFHEVGAAVSAGSCRGSGAALRPAELHRRGGAWAGAAAGDTGGACSGRARAGHRRRDDSAGCRQQLRVRCVLCGSRELARSRHACTPLGHSAVIAPVCREGS